MKLTTQDFYRVSVYMKDNKKEFKQYYVAADSIAIVEYKLKKGNISDNVYINTVLNTGQCLIRETEKEAELPLKKNDVIERIKTFEDAYDELGREHPYCKVWDSIYQTYKDSDCEGLKNIIAHQKLCIIAAALNEGWEPEFTKEKSMYYPYFRFYTKEEVDGLSEEEKRHSHPIYSKHYDTSNDCFICANSYYVFCDELSVTEYRLAFKNVKLAKYAGQQFIDIYKDFIA